MSYYLMHKVVTVVGHTTARKRERCVCYVELFHSFLLERQVNYRQRPVVALLPMSINHSFLLERQVSHRQRPLVRRVAANEP